MEDKTIEKLEGVSYDAEYLVIKQSGVQATYPIHTHDFYEFFIVTRGRALHIVNSTTHLIERGTLVLIRPRDVHFYDSYNTNIFEFYNMGISVETFESINRYYGGALDIIEKDEFPKHVMLDDLLTDQLERQLIQIKEESAKNIVSPLYYLVIAFVCYLVLSGVEREPQDYMPDWLFRLLEEMEKQENYLAGLPRLLELAKYSQEYVDRSFRKFLRTSPTHFINAKRLAYARTLLNDTALSVSDICEQSGFHNLSYFYEQYKACYGRTPGKRA
jgi:AraC family transcriptional regulator, dual regulator of chb operon